MRGRYNQFDEQDLIQQIKELIRRVEDLEKGAGIGSTAIDAGDLAITNGSMTVGTSSGVFMGPQSYGSDTGTGWVFRRNNGTIALALTGNSTDHQGWELLDNAQNTLVADDAMAEEGLARPYIPINFDVHSSTAPTVTTVSGTFVPLFTGRYLKQHPRVQVEIWATASSGATSGEVQLYCATNADPVIQTPISIPLGYNDRIILGPSTVEGLFLQTLEIEVQARRTAGAGTIGIRVMNAYGLES